MRADRLLLLLMLLQAKGSMKARELAIELEVTERTIRRDIDALSVAGVPVYGSPGRDGGYDLLDGYRTNLTGLTKDQMAALFLLNIPTPLNDLGIAQEIKAALLKLSAALPVPQRDASQQLSQRIYLDATWWFENDEDLPYLKTIHEAVMQDHWIRITRRLRFGHPQDLEHMVEPYGLVAKAGVWYLVCAQEGRVHAHRVSHILNVQMLDEHFVRPADFDLEAFWKAWSLDFRANRIRYPVLVSVAPHFVSELSGLFGEHVHEQIAMAGPPDRNGWITIELLFESLWSARSRLLSFGGAVKVVEPEPLRLSMVDFARQVLKVYEY